MNQFDLPDFLQAKPALKPRMFAAPSASLTRLRRADPAVLSQMVNASQQTGFATDRPGRLPLPQEAAASRAYDGMAQGSAARIAPVGIRSDTSRALYESGVAKLEPWDRAGREALKARTRAIMPPETLAPLKAWRPSLGPVSGSGARANVSNEAINRLARRLGTAGRGAGLIGALIALDDILTSHNHQRAIVANIGAGLGGFAGGAAGATAGAATGPAAPVLAPAGGLAGSIAGGKLGYEAGEGLYDFVTGR